MLSGPVRTPVGTTPGSVGKPGDTPPGLIGGTNEGVIPKPPGAGSEVKTDGCENTGDRGLPGIIEGPAGMVNGIPGNGTPVVVLSPGLVKRPPLMGRDAENGSPPGFPPLGTPRTLNGLEGTGGMIVEPGKGMPLTSPPILPVEHEEVSGSPPGLLGAIGVITVAPPGMFGPPGPLGPLTMGNGENGVGMLGKPETSGPLAGELGPAPGKAVGVMPGPQGIPGILGILGSGPSGIGVIKPRSVVQVVSEPVRPPGILGTLGIAPGKEVGATPGILELQGPLGPPLIEKGENGTGTPGMLEAPGPVGLTMGKYVSEPSPVVRVMSTLPGSFDTVPVAKVRGNVSVPVLNMLEPWALLGTNDGIEGTIVVAMPGILELSGLVPPPVEKGSPPVAKGLPPREETAGIVMVVVQGASGSARLLVAKGTSGPPLLTGHGQEVISAPGRSDSEEDTPMGPQVLGEYGIPAIVTVIGPSAVDHHDGTGLLPYPHPGLVPGSVDQGGKFGLVKQGIVVVLTGDHELGPKGNGTPTVGKSVPTIDESR